MKNLAKIIMSKFLLNPLVEFLEVMPKIQIQLKSKTHFFHLNSSYGLTQSTERGHPSPPGHHSAQPAHLACFPLAHSQKYVFFFGLCLPISTPPLSFLADPRALCISFIPFPTRPVISPCLIRSPRDASLLHRDAK
jgi:hypothetical protein